MWLELNPVFLKENTALKKKNQLKTHKCNISKSEFHIRFLIKLLLCSVTATLLLKVKKVNVLKRKKAFMFFPLYILYTDNTQSLQACINSKTMVN